MPTMITYHSFSTASLDDHQQLIPVEACWDEMPPNSLLDHDPNNNMLLSCVMLISLSIVGLNSRKTMASGFVHTSP